MLSIFRIFDTSEKKYLKLTPATLRDRFIAQLIDGIFLGVVCSSILYIMSDGKVFSIWAAPIFPVYILEVDSAFISTWSDFWWGGYYASFRLFYGKIIYVNYPAPLLIAIYIGYYVFFTSIYGQTLGKMLKHLVVLDKDKEVVSLRITMLRWLGYFVTLLPFGMGLKKALREDGAPLWHDTLSKSQVLRFERI